MIIGTSIDGVVRQCEKCSTVYKGNHCPHCAVVKQNEYEIPKQEREKTYAEAQIEDSLRMSAEQEKQLKESLGQKPQAQQTEEK